MNRLSTLGGMMDFDGMNKEDSRIRLELHAEEDMMYPLTLINDYVNRFGRDRWLKKYVYKNRKQWDKEQSYEDGGGD